MTKLEILPAYCLACGKFLGDVTGESLHRINPLCYDCLREHFPKLPTFKYVEGSIDLVRVNE